MVSILLLEKKERIKMTNNRDDSWFTFGFALFMFLALWFLAIGCSNDRAHYPSDRIPVVERPTVNLPYVFRQANWNKNGSCVHASMVSLFKWQGEKELAKLWRGKYRGGEWASRLASRLEANGVRYAYVTNGDVSFLEWACDTRRGCGITVDGGSHMVTLVHLDSEWAATLDNNDISKFNWIPRKKLIAEWKASYGWAVTPVYSPAAPLPW
jgi:hypothetical protein